MTGQGGGARIVAERLCETAGGRQIVDVAQIQFVGVEELRRAYIHRWPEQQARIQEIAETFLRRRMRPGDLLFRRGEGFLLAFAAAGGEASLTACLLAHDLNTSFLAEATRTPIPQVSVRSATVAVDDLAGRLGDSTPFACSPEARRAPSVDGDPDCDWRFQPVWDVKRETLTCWYATPVVRDDRVRIPGYQFETQPATPGLFAALDLASLAVAEAQVRRLIDQGKQALVGSSIHVTSLASPAVRVKLLAAMASTPPELSRYRVVKIAAIPSGMPRPLLGEMVASLRSRLSNVVLGAAWDEPDFAGLAACDASAIGLSIPPQVSSPHSNVPRATLKARVMEAVSAAHAARKRLFVEGAVHHELAATLRLLGVDNIASPQVWPPTAEADAMLKWPAERLAVAA